MPTSPFPRIFKNLRRLNDHLKRVLRCDTTDFISIPFSCVFTMLALRLLFTYLTLFKQVFYLLPKQQIFSFLETNVIFFSSCTWKSHMIYKLHKIVNNPLMLKKTTSIMIFIRCRSCFCKDACFCNKRNSLDDLQCISSFCCSRNFAW